MQRVKIVVTGLVQGVGFRPFVYNLARRLNIVGWIVNTAAGVEIEAEGSKANVEAFLAALAGQAPPLAVIDGLQVSELAPNGEEEFTIRESLAAARRQALVSPDIAVCDDCLGELAEKHDRRFDYPFINCTNCGPRYSIIKSVPYDRVATTMAGFNMCPLCTAEYKNAADRRFHAQPNACPVCGPSYSLLDKHCKKVVVDGNMFDFAKTLVKEGAIIAVKGIGGYHLACDAFNEQAVYTLRQRKGREYKPLAVMAGSLATACRQCDISSAEAQLLLNIARPIVLLTKGAAYNLAGGIAPGNPCLGVMLPYAPVHYLLLDSDDVWVMTSGNSSQEPIIYQDEEAFARLHGMADYFLTHNRPIYRHVDDSVTRVLFEKPYIIRRSRGYVPAPIELNFTVPPLLSTGGELKNTFCLARGKQAFLSAHVGDLINQSTYNLFIDTIEHYSKLFDIKPVAVAYDLHPGYLAGKYALSLQLPHIGVQHHQAHIAAVMAEQGLEGPVIGAAFDGTGYGLDGNLWGGEFLVGDLNGFSRAAHCKYLRLPGGEMAIQQPWRLAAWLLYELFGSNMPKNIEFCRNLPASWQMVVDAAAKGVNAPFSSSIGRLFDAAAALLNIRTAINYEGQAAVELELAAYGQTGPVLPYEIINGQPSVVDFMPAFRALAEQLAKKVPPTVLAASFHRTVAAATVEMIGRISRDTGIRRVALSGGVWQNMLLLTEVSSLLAAAGFTVYTHSKVPPNDGGVALGQAVIAGHKLK